MPVFPVSLGSVCFRGFYLEFLPVETSARRELRVELGDVKVLGRLRRGVDEEAGALADLLGVAEHEEEDPLEDLAIALLVEDGFTLNSE